MPLRTARVVGIIIVTSAESNQLAQPSCNVVSRAVDVIVGIARRVQKCLHCG